MFFFTIVLTVSILDKIFRLIINVNDFFGILKVYESVLSM